MAGFHLHDPAFEDWLRDARLHLRERACEDLSRLLDHQSAGNTEQAIATARRLLALDPLREATHRVLMRLYFEKGDRNLALKQYQRCQEALNAELGVGPELATKELYNEIAQEDATTTHALRLQRVTRSMSKTVLWLSAGTKPGRGPNQQLST